MNKILLLIILLLSNCFAQNITIINGIARDTSFSSGSEIKKVQKLFPFAEIVKLIIPPNVDVIRDLKYVTYDNRSLCLDIFLPKNVFKKHLPCILIIHGGGWFSGNKGMEWPTAIALASNGFITATVEYRLSPEALYPAAIYDLKNAVKWIKGKSTAYRIDTNKVAVLGGSAGGELAAFIGATNNISKFDQVIDSLSNSSSVQAVIDIDGILDFTHPAESGKDVNPLKPSAGKKWFGYSIKENSSVWIEASPMMHINKNTPPILFINSSIERFRAGRDIVIERLNGYNIYYELYELPNTPHTFWMFKPWFDITINHVINFLNKVFLN